MNKVPERPMPNVTPMQAAGSMITTGILLMVGGLAVICGCLAFALLSN